MKKPFPTYTQLDAMDCDPTCLRMIANYYSLVVRDFVYLYFVKVISLRLVRRFKRLVRGYYIKTNYVCQK